MVAPQIFHENTNLHTATGSLPPGKTYTAKIAPPVLGGKKVGVFATRTPHRPNPIGLSVVRLDSISTSPNAIHISGVDLVNGTPVIDIKPYVPSYDSVPGATSPEWTHQDPNANTRRRKVTFQPVSRRPRACVHTHARAPDPAPNPAPSPAALARRVVGLCWCCGAAVRCIRQLRCQGGRSIPPSPTPPPTPWQCTLACLLQAAEHALQTLYTKSRYYDSCAALREALAEVLHLDIRSVHQGRGTTTGESRMYSLRFDGLVIDFATMEESIVVHSVVSL